jgi:hypothetical protein
LLLLVALSTVSCKRPYRVGDHVLVEWEDGSPNLYPGYILAQVSETRYRIHFEGYDSRFDEDVSVDQIKSMVQGPVVAPPPPRHVARVVGLPREPDAGAALVVNPYKAGDRLRVRWRGSIYSAVVLEVVAKDRVQVRYEGHESAWDEVVPLDRIVGKR